jgi:hypothetical protein
MIRFLDAAGLAVVVYAVECGGQTYTPAEIEAERAIESAWAATLQARLEEVRARVLRLERAIEAQWCAWYMYDSDPMHQDAEAARAADRALWALIGKEPAP